MQFFHFALVVVSICIHGTVIGQEHRREIDFESDLLSWPRMKRFAGYFSEGGRYRGGVYKWARDEEHEYYHCLRNNTDHCLLWSTRETSSEEREEGTCNCREGDFPYCAAWICSQVEIAFGARCSGEGSNRRCRDVVQGEYTECSCEETDAAGRYCRVWRCFEDGADGFIEEEEYTCLEEDISGEYCFRWKGDISSSFELESSVCECVDRAENYCDYWECKERGLIRCAAHASSWCDLNVAIGVGGGLGIVFILIGFLIALIPDSIRQRFCNLMIFFLFGCLPMTLGVLVWGGVRALPIVAIMWGSTLALSCCVIWFISGKHDRKT